LCAVADAFDALTSERPYRKPLPVGEALTFLEARAGKQFDSEIVRCWIQTVNRKR
jgi:HD-GYP domain-containing protein (c-di-GMP phosphodiesterase class II)